jgi:hypothetical protein
LPSILPTAPHSSSSSSIIIWSCYNSPINEPSNSGLGSTPPQKRGGGMP